MIEFFITFYICLATFLVQPATYAFGSFLAHTHIIILEALELFIGLIASYVRFG